MIISFTKRLLIKLGQRFILSDKPLGSGITITVTDVTRVLQMLEVSRNALRFADTIEYSMFAQASGVT
jgi:hypothetical protein